MHDSNTNELNPIVRRFIEDAGNTTQAFGVGRVLGQIYAYLYFSESARNLENMHVALGISKGSSSTGVRQLEQWGAVRKVWIKGDRRDYYEAVDWFGRILKVAIQDTVGKKLMQCSDLVDEVEGNLDQLTGEESEFVKARVRRLRRFQNSAQKMWEGPLMKLLLK